MLKQRWLRDPRKDKEDYVILISGASGNAGGAVLHAALALDCRCGRCIAASRMRPKRLQE